MAKIMLLGEIGVGKTSLVRRFVFQRFEADYKSTIGVNIQTHDARRPDGAALRLALWDTDGEFGTSIFDTVYVKGASGAIIVSDASREPTIAKAAHLAIRFMEQFPGRPTRIVVNKIDLGEANEACLAKAGLAPHEILRSSALTGEGVLGVFESIGEDVVRRGLC